MKSNQKTARALIPSITLALLLCGFFSISITPVLAADAGTSVTILPSDNATFSASANQDEQGQVLGEKIINNEATGKVQLTQPAKESSPATQSNTSKKARSISDSDKFIAVFTVIMLCCMLLVLMIGSKKRRR